MIDTLTLHSQYIKHISPKSNILKFYYNSIITAKITETNHVILQKTHKFYIWAYSDILKVYLWLVCSHLESVKNHTLYLVVLVLKSLLIYNRPNFFSVYFYDIESLLPVVVHFQICNIELISLFSEAYYVITLHNNFLNLFNMYILNYECMSAREHRAMTEKKNQKERSVFLFALNIFFSFLLQCNTHLK